MSILGICYHRHNWPAECSANAAHFSHPHSAVPFVYQRPGQVTHDPCYLRHKLPTECSPSTAHSSSAFLIRIPHPHSVPHDMIVRHWPSAAPPTPGSGIHVAVGI